MLDWIAGATSTSVTDDTRHHFNIYVVASLLSTTLAGFAWLTLLSLARRDKWLSDTEASPPRGGAAVLCVLFGGLAAALWAGEYYWSGEAWQMARLRQTAPLYLGLSSRAVGAPYAALVWRPRDFRPLLHLRDALIGLFGAAILFGGYALVANAYYFHAMFAAWRLPMVLWWGFALLPVTIVVREVGPRRSGLSGYLLALVARISVWTTLLAIHALGRKPSGASEVMSLLGVERDRAPRGWTTRASSYDSDGSRVGPRHGLPSADQ